MKLELQIKCPKIVPWKTQLEAAKCVQDRLQVIREQEQQIPTIKAAVEKIKDEDLPFIFVEQFQKPTSDKLNRYTWVENVICFVSSTIFYREIELAQEIGVKRAEATGLQLRRLKELASMTNAGSQWLLHLRVAALVRRVLFQAPIGDFFHKTIRQVIVLTPTEDVADVKSLLQVNSADAFADFGTTELLKNNNVENSKY